MNLFKSLMYLGSLDPTTSRSFEDEDQAFRPTYGNRVAFERRFGIHRPGHPVRLQRRRRSHGPSRAAAVESGLAAMAADPLRRQK